MNIEYTNEQKNIIDAVLSGKNCVVDAVAGSGKTTTIMGIAKSAPEKRILQITYNRHLKDEVKEKRDKAGLSNMDVFTYHGLCVRYYERRAFNDEAIKAVVKHKKQPIARVADFDILVIDEAQDMTFLLFTFMKKFVADYGKKIVLLVLGDVNQAIYEFKGSDKRFLSLADHIWGEFGGEFVKLPLHTSHRLTHPMGAFINKVMFGEDRIQTVRDGPPIQFIRDNAFSVDIAFQILIDCLNSKGYKPSDIFVLGPSIRSKKGSSLPINGLENALVQRGIPCFSPNDDEQDIKGNQIEGKVVFSTYHQAKGRERKINVVYGFDASWFDYYGRDANRRLCPNEQYVASSRGLEVLILLEDAKMPLPFLKNREKFSEMNFIQYHEKYKLPMKHGLGFESSGSKNPNTSPTDLLRHLNEEVTYVLSQIRDQVFQVHTVAQKDLDIRSEIPNYLGGVENVSDLNGLCIPALWEKKRTGGKSQVEKDIHCLLSNKTPDIIMNNLHLSGKGETLPEFLRLCNVYQALNTSFHAKLAQIKEYTWLSEELVESCHAGMSKRLGEVCLFEQSIEAVKYSIKDFGCVEVHGRLDAFDENAVWEFKCVSSLQLEHFIQLILYAWLWKQPQGGGEIPSYFEQYGARRFLLMNIRTEEIYELDAEHHLLEEVVMILMDNKYKNKEKISNAVFIERCKRATVNETVNDEVLLKEGERLEFYSLEELREICRDRRIKGFSGLTKDEIIAKIQDFLEKGVALKDRTVEELQKMVLEKCGSAVYCSKKKKAELIALLEG
jgi:hypothetical protein